MSKSMIKAKINLAKLPHVIMTRKGKKAEGIFIPIENAKLFKSEKGNVYLDLVAFEFNEKKHDDTHFIKQSLSKDERDKMTEEERNNMPFLGNMTYTEGFGEEEPNSFSGGAVVGEDGSDDDLPF